MLLIVSELWFIFFEDPTNLEVPSLNLRLSHLSPQKDIAKTVDNDVLLVELTVFWCLYLIFWLRNKTMQKRRSPLVYEIFHPSKPYLHHPSCFIGAHFTGNLHPRIQQWPRGPLLGGSSQLIPLHISGGDPNHLGEPQDAGSDVAMATPSNESMEGPSISMEDGNGRRCSWV